MSDGIVADGMSRSLCISLNDRFPVLVLVINYTLRDKHLK